MGQNSVKLLWFFGVQGQTRYLQIVNHKSEDRES